MDSVFVKLSSVTENKEKTDLFYKMLSKAKVKKEEQDKFISQFEEIVSMFSPKENAYALLKKGEFYHLIHDEKRSYKYFYESLAAYEKINDKQGQAKVINKIAGAMREAKNLSKAAPNFYRSLQLATITNDKDLIANNHSAIGGIFKDLVEVDSSLFHHNISLQIRLELNDDKNIARCYNDIGLTYKIDKNYNKSLEYLLKSLALSEKVQDKKSIAGSCINIGNTLKRLKRNKEALEYFDRGIEIARKNGFTSYYINGLGGRSENALAMGDYKTAANDMFRYNNAQDSIYSENLKTQLNELDASYQSEKKDAEIELQQEQIKTKTEQNSKQKILIIASVIALVMAIIAIFVVYRSYRQNKRNAKVLAAKNLVIEEKNKEITDSINYAKLIQQSLLASKEMLDKNLRSYFVLYKPKDIVSGDFYWASETPKGFLIACVDCTGHGVPGAFMSLIGKENLDKALAKTVNPGEILHELNINVKRSLNQNNTTGNKDGMDAAILRIERDTNGNAKVAYAGANRPLYILKSNLNNVEEIKATKQAVGGFTSNEQVFEEHIIQVNKGDTLIITTDGYADQFGSESNKKLTTKRFKELLVSVKAKTADEQMKTLNEFFTIWKGNREQLDDLLVIGINV